jgi:hypothetical protein
MIYIEKDTTNLVALSLTESSELSSPFYLFVFENEFDTAEEPIFFYSPDISQWKDRYNLFSITEGTDITLIKGQYTYNVYEATSQPSDIGDTTGKVIEEGRMIVSSDVVTFNSIYD